MSWDVLPPDARKWVLAIVAELKDCCPIGVWTAHRARVKGRMELRSGAGRIGVWREWNLPTHVLFQAQFPTITTELGERVDTTPFEFDTKTMTHVSLAPARRVRVGRPPRQVARELVRHVIEPMSKPMAEAMRKVDDRAKSATDIVAFAKKLGFEHSVYGRSEGHFVVNAKTWSGRGQLFAGTVRVFDGEKWVPGTPDNNRSARINLDLTWRQLEAVVAILNTIPKDPP